ncbi:MAG: hypothetical protein U0835_12495 [Isosphaeraceae bacterium]
MLPRASEGAWSPEELFLYDLQRVCVEHEKPPYRINLIGWVTSLGRRPLRHNLPRLRQVAAVGRLRQASHRLSRIRIGRDDRARLEAVVKSATTRAEKALRDDLRPQIASVLEQTWIAPANLPERVAASKTVEELLDRIVENGRSALGDLRDSASASDLKSPDLKGPGDLWAGGRLLETDRALAASLEGVHRRGEIYLRALQRFSMLAFGTHIGRLITRYVALPFGGAFVALEGIQHLVGPLVHRVSGVDPPFNNPFSVLVVGLVATLMINSASFRAAMGRALGRIGTAVRVLLVDWPTRLITAPWVRRILGLRFLVLVRTCVVWPGLAAGAAWWLSRSLGAGPAMSRGTGAGAFLASNLVFNTAAGQALLERLADACTRGWRALWNDLLPGLFRFVVDLFRSILAAVEREIYTVDEWLRFRRGESPLAFLSKALVGPAWAVAAYLARIYIIVLIEPQVNPIKHFPVVTVSHKVILPMTLQITRVLEAPLAPVVGGGAAAAVAWTTVFLLPGMFGFLVWELKSNWRLYRANRSRSLGPVAVGSHGESVVRLLRPGFHAGTLPRAFAGLRRARRSTWIDPVHSRSEKTALRRREALHHVEEALRKFVERELLTLLRGSRGLGGSVLILGETVLATNRVRLELIRREDGHDEPHPLVIDVEERSGRLVAGVHEPGWLDRLTSEERVTLADALAGLFKKCGVDLVQTPGEVVPGPSARDLGAASLTWDAWVERWNLDASDTPPDRPLIELPGVTSADPEPEPSGVTRLG